MAENEANETTRADGLPVIKVDRSPKDVDWEAIALEWRAGQLSRQTISMTYGISPSRISQKMQEMGVTRDLRREVRDRAAVGLINDGLTPEQRTEDAVGFAARRAVEVVRSHRSLLGRLGKAAEGLLTKLETVIAEETPEKAAFLASTLLGGDSPTDTLIKIANTAAKVIPLERQAFDLDLSGEYAGMSDEQLLRKACGEDVMDRLKATEGDD
jgi:hypothetical protein